MNYFLTKKGQIVCFLGHRLRPALHFADGREQHEHGTARADDLREYIVVFFCNWKCFCSESLLWPPNRLHAHFASVTGINFFLKTQF